MQNPGVLKNPVPDHPVRAVPGHQVDLEAQEIRSLGRQLSGAATRPVADAGGGRGEGPQPLRRKPARRPQSAADPSVTGHSSITASRSGYAQAAEPGRASSRALRAVISQASAAAWSRISGTAVLSYHRPRSGGPSV